MFLEYISFYIMHICLYKKALRFLSAAMYWTVASVGFANYLIIVLERRHRNNFFFLYLIYVVTK